MALADVTAWQGRSSTETATMDAAQAARVHATIGDPHQGPPRAGDPLPALWHWCLFTPSDPMARLGRDGHPATGGFLPHVGLERRMWAGGALRFHAPLRVGEPVTRVSSVRSVVEKQTASGPMVLVSVDHVISGSRGVAVQERQDIVYLQIPDRFVPPRQIPLPDAPVLHHVAPMSETLLFRYSAITFNAHRIHYDLAYTREVEHYPALVVHGPLQATLLMQAACDHRRSRPAQFDFRARHPMFAGDALDIMGVEEDANSLTLWTGQKGYQGMQATAIWEGTV